MYECLKVGKEANQKIIQTYFQDQVGIEASTLSKKQTNKTTTNKQTNKKTDKQTSASKQTNHQNK